MSLRIDTSARAFVVDSADYPPASNPFRWVYHRVAFVGDANFTDTSRTFRMRDIKHRSNRDAVFRVVHRCIDFGFRYNNFNTNIQIQSKPTEID